MNFVIDIGNSRAKLGIFKEEILINKYEGLEKPEIFERIEESKPDAIIISAVGEARGILNKLEGKVKCIVLDENTPLPIKNNYSTPKTLGPDRIAAAVGAYNIYPKKNCLIIDIGTCITYEFIDQNAVYHGGAISPGLGIRFKGLNTFTAKLPLVELQEDASLIGKTTHDCILSGVLNGATAEMNEIIRMYSDKFANLQIIICGGDAKFFEKRIKSQIFVEPDLVLKGLHRILKYNVFENL